MNGGLSRIWRPKDLRPSTRYSRTDDRSDGGMVVPPWPATIIDPVLEVACTAPAAELLPVLAEGLDRAGFTISDVTAEGFRATRVPWLDVITLQSWGRTIIAVHADESTSPQTTVLLTVELGYEHSAAKHRAVDGLNQVIADLQSRNVETSVVDWRPAGEV